MNPTEFKAFIRETIATISKESNAAPVKETITRKELKTVIKEAIKVILQELAVIDPKKKDEEKDETELKEMTTTSAVAPINLPGNVRGGWVSRQGGSKRGLAGSASLGYELTKVGKKDFDRDKQDPV